MREGRKDGGVIFDVKKWKESRKENLDDKKNGEGLLKGERKQR